MAIEHSERVKHLIIHHLEKIADGIKDVPNNYFETLDEKDYECGTRMVTHLDDPSRLLKIDVKVSYQEWKP